MYQDYLDTISFVKNYDNEVADAMGLELKRQQANIELIASENFVSPAVMAAMGGMAQHFGEDVSHWQAVGYLHDYDYEQYPTEHLQHTAEPLRAEGVSEEDIRATGSIYFKSSNTNVATVDTVTGEVTCVGEGTATITAYVSIDNKQCNYINCLY